MKFHHYFDQNRIEKKDGEYKINEHKEKENGGEGKVTNKLQDQIKYQEKNNNLATANNIRQLPTEKKKKIFIVGGSIIKNITGAGISRDHTVKIRPYPGATSIDMCDYIKPEMSPAR